MQFEWDEAKRVANAAKHGIDFRTAIELFDGRPTVTFLSTYPAEERFITTGIIHDRFVTVIWTRREKAIRIISARRARDKERRPYFALYN
jgi:uncharacterized DUF497 family protein